MTDEVLVHEGWLMKRGAGYQKGFGTDLSTARSVRSASNQGSAHLMRNSSKVSLAQTLSNTFKGRQERRRYFKLMKTKSPASGILCYYINQNSTKEVKRIVFSHLDKVELTEDNTVELSTMRRTYYLRPTGMKGELGEEKSQVAAAQWLHAIQGVLEFILQARGFLDSSQTLLNTRSINTHASENIDVDTGDYSYYSGTDFVDDDDCLTLPVQSSFKEQIQRPLGTYQEIWNKYGFEGFLQVLSHYGAIETDLSRLKGNISGKIESLEENLKHLEANKNVASEPVIKHQKTAFEAFRALYEQDKKSAELYRKARDCLRKLLKKFESGRADIVEDIAVTKKAHQFLIDDLKQKKAAMGKARARVKQSEEIVATAQENLAKDNTSTNTKLMSVFQMMKDRITKTESTRETPEQQVESLQLDLKHKIQVERTLTSVFKDTEKEAALRMRVFLGELQKIEETRIGFQKRIIEELAAIELGLVTGLIAQYEVPQHGNPSVLEAIDRIVPEDDLKSTSEELATMAKTAVREHKLLKHRTD